MPHDASDHVEAMSSGGPRVPVTYAIMCQAGTGYSLWLSNSHEQEHPMPQRTATIESLPIAFALVKEMQADGLEWGEDYRPLGR